MGGGDDNDTDNPPEEIIKADKVITKLQNNAKQDNSINGDLIKRMDQDGEYDEQEQPVQRLEKPILKAGSVGSVLGLIFGFLIGLPISLAFISGSLAMVVASRDDEIGVKAQKVSKTTVELVESATSKALKNETIEKFVRKAETINKEYDVSSKVHSAGKVLASTSKLVYDKGKELNERYSIGEKVLEKVKEVDLKTVKLGEKEQFDKLQKGVSSAVRRTLTKVVAEYYEIDEIR